MGKKGSVLQGWGSGSHNLSRCVLQQLLWHWETSFIAAPWVLTCGIPNTSKCCWSLHQPRFLSLSIHLTIRWNCVRNAWHRSCQHKPQSNTWRRHNYDRNPVKRWLILCHCQKICLKITIKAPMCASCYLPDRLVHVVPTFSSPFLAPRNKTEECTSLLRWPTSSALLLNYSRALKCSSVWQHATRVPLFVAHESGRTDLSIYAWEDARECVHCDCVRNQALLPRYLQVLLLVRFDSEGPLMNSGWIIDKMARRGRHYEIWVRFDAKRMQRTKPKRHWWSLHVNTCYTSQQKHTSL